ncbi:hypothetical protein [Actinomadura hibisca]|uniref:hypothetical protein n=1 Tax=Actinomadura hibisca TaxID=68565 RepID=UPI0012F9A09E|nr:hypothetical protein [Actinomadura hibisca]
MSWDQVFQVLGHGLPADYIAFAEVYGRVCFNDELAVDDLRRLSPEQLRQNRLHTNVLRIGDTACGTYMAWLTEGHPDYWPVTDSEFASHLDGPDTELRPWAHVPLTRFLLEKFTTDKYWFEQPPTTFTPAEIWQRAHPMGDAADNPFL